jgi:hypothetical protein
MAGGFVAVGRVSQGWLAVLGRSVITHQPFILLNYWSALAGSEEVGVWNKIFSVQVIPEEEALAAAWQCLG